MLYALLFTGLLHAGSLRCGFGGHDYLGTESVVTARWQGAKINSVTLRMSSGRTFRFRGRQIETYALNPPQFKAESGPTVLIGLLRDFDGQLEFSSQTFAFNLLARCSYSR